MKKFILPLLILFLVAIGVGYYMYNKPHRDVSSEKVKYNFTDVELNQQLSSNLDSAFAALGDQVIAVTGNIKEIEGDTAKMIILDGVAIQMKESEAVFEKGEKVTVKARLTGFDDLFMEARLDQGTIVHSKNN